MSGDAVERAWLARRLSPLHPCPHRVVWLTPPSRAAVSFCDGGDRAAEAARLARSHGLPAAPGLSALVEIRALHQALPLWAAAS